MGLSLQGRISAVLGANFPGLPALPVRPVAGSGLTRPARGLLLNGTLTAESANPTLLTVSSAGCKPILGFSYAPVPSLPPYELPVAVKCEQGGRRWIVSGIEWADLAAQSPSDRTIVSDWMQEVLK